MIGDKETGFFITSGELVNDSEINYFVAAYNKLEQAKEYNLTATALKLLRIDSEYKYTVLFDVIAHIKEILAEHEERQMKKRLKHGN